MLKAKNRNFLVPRNRRFTPLRVEPLEDRRLLAAVITVNSTADTDVRDTLLTMREAILINNRTLAFASLSPTEQGLVSGAPASDDADTINFNIAGGGVQTISPTSALPAITDPVTINGYSQPGASANTNPVGQGLNTVLTIELAGNSAGTGVHGLRLGTGSGGSTIKGLVINRFAGDGIRVDSSGNILVGNFVGTNPLGSAASANGATGVHVFGANNTVGGTAAADRNLFSGNTVTGLVLEGAGATANFVRGNLMGTSATGTAAVPNGGAVGIINAGGNTIGGTASGAGNLLSGNTFDGVVTFGAAATGNFIQGNLIGTNVSGTAALANGRHGVWVLQSGSGNTIGGTAVGARNVISGNTQVGVLIESTSGTVIQGNFIGTDATGQSAIANKNNGVSIARASNNTIGGGAVGAGNLISGNSQNGVATFRVDVTPSANNLIQGNSIGTNSDGSSPVPNALSGVVVADTDNTVSGNRIAFNGADGVTVFGSSNPVLSNSIFANAGLGIDLAPDGPNFPQRPDGLGVANRGQSFPVLSSVTDLSAGTRITGSLASNVGRTYRIEFFSTAAADASGFGEGQTYLGAIELPGGQPVFSADVSLRPTGQPAVMATATDITVGQFEHNNNTSEFSAAFVPGAPPFVCSVTNTASTGPGSLRAGIDCANNHGGVDRIEFNIPANDTGHVYYKNDGVAGTVKLANVTATTAADDATISDIDPDWPHSWFSIAPTTPLPSITDPVIIDGTTQPGTSVNTNPLGQGLNTVLKIEVSGQNAGNSSLLQFAGPGGNALRGLVLNRTTGKNVLLANQTTGTRIEGNFIGPDVSGTLAFPLLSSGVYANSSGNTIGGTTPDKRNLISGNNLGDGITLFSYTMPSLVQGNLIGTDRTGTKALGNVGYGVRDGSYNDDVIGGEAAGAGNVISGNQGGIYAVSNINTGAIIQGNWIGTDVTGTLDLGNAGSGIDFLSFAEGGNRAEANIIAFNSTGIVIDNKNQLVSRNSIFSNDKLGIGDDSDKTIKLTSVTAGGLGTQIAGSIAKTANTPYRLEFFANPEREESTNIGTFDLPGINGEGKTFIGELLVTTNASGIANFSVDLPVNLLALPGENGQPFVTATATDLTDTGSGPRNKTSLFSPIAVLGGPSFVVTNTGETGLGTLREAIINANLTAGPQTISFAIPASDPKHFYYKDDGVAGTVSPASIATTAAATDAAIPTIGVSAIDPDWPHSWFSIRPSHNLQRIIDTITIDGYTQAGSSPNTLPALGPLNTVLKIELDGTNALGDGLNLTFGTQDGSLSDAADSTIRGLAINRFGGDGIELNTLDGGNTIAGNFIGTDVSGALDLGNLDNGVYIDFEPNDAIGGTTPAARNLISGNDSNGLEIFHSRDIIVRGNLFGTARDRSATLANGESAVLLSQSAIVAVGGLVVGAGNVIAGHSGLVILAAANSTTLASSGVSATQADTYVDPCAPEYNALVDAYKAFNDGPTGATLQNLVNKERAYLNCLRPAVETSEESSDSIDSDDNEYDEPEEEDEDDDDDQDLQAFTNSLGPAAVDEPLAIDLGGDGVTPNDGDNPATPEVDPDSDIGVNHLQNYPVLTSAITGEVTRISGTLNSTPRIGFRIQLFSNSRLNATGHGPGEKLLGFVHVTTDANGNASFTLTTSEAVPAGQFITSTATFVVPQLDGTFASLHTSEFSAGVPVRENPWHNKAKPLDVTDDTFVVAADALEIINYINGFGSTPVPPTADYGVPFFYDPTNDLFVAPNDVLDIINAINAGEAEGESADRVALSSPGIQNLKSKIQNPPSPDLLSLLALDLATQPKRRR